MKTQEAIRILMLSPCYWRLKLPDRKELVREFMVSYSALEWSFESAVNRKRTNS
jgi:hypothetical protein